MIALLCRDLGRCLRSWWRNDRIRVSPREGRLFRIEPGDLLHIGDFRAEVLARDIVEAPTGDSLSLICCTQTATVELRIGNDDDWSTATINWKGDDDFRRFSSDEIEIWPGRRATGLDRGGISE